MQTLRSESGVFNFEKFAFDEQCIHKENSDDSSADSFQQEQENARDKDLSVSKFQIRGTNYITKNSRASMYAVSPLYCSENQKDMGTLLVIKEAEDYSIYQSKDLQIDLSKQTPLGPSSEFESQQLEEILKRSSLVVRNSRICKCFDQENGRRSSKKAKSVFKTGQILRQGDIFRLGRAAILVRVWTNDSKRWAE